MKEIGMYTYYDKKSERYDTPFFCANDVMAERKFVMDIRNKETLVSQFKDDFQLWKVGLFDVETGIFTMSEEFDDHKLNYIVREGIQIEEDKA